jgi:hypothetical protein
MESRLFLFELLRAPEPGWRPVPLTLTLSLREREPPTNRLEHMEQLVGKPRAEWSSLSLRERAGVRGNNPPARSDPFRARRFMERERGNTLNWPYELPTRSPVPRPAY